MLLAVVLLADVAESEGRHGSKAVCCIAMDCCGLIDCGATVLDFCLREMFQSERLWKRQRKADGECD